MLNKERVKRLQKLYYILTNHTKIFGRNLKFNIGTWCDTEKKSNGKICNTAACALGSAGLYPPFMKLGLKTNPQHSEVYYKGKSACEAGAAFFGITEDESENIFWPDSYANECDDEFEKIKPRHVAKRVKQLIAKYKTA